MTLGGGTPTGGLVRSRFSLAGVRSPRVAMPSTSPSDERTCDTTTLLRHYLYLSTWFLTAPSSLSFSTSPYLYPRLCRFPHPWILPPSPAFILFLHLQPPTARASFPPELLTFPVLLALPGDISNNAPSHCDSISGQLAEIRQRPRISRRTFETRFFLSFRNCIKKKKNTNTSKDVWETIIMFVL